MKTFYDLKWKGKHDFAIQDRKHPVYNSFDRSIWFCGTKISIRLPCSFYRKNVSLSDVYFSTFLVSVKILVDIVILFTCFLHLHIYIIIQERYKKSGGLDKECIFYVCVMLLSYSNINLLFILFTEKGTIKFIIIYCS